MKVRHFRRCWSLSMATRWNPQRDEKIHIKYKKCVVRDSEKLSHPSEQLQRLPELMVAAKMTRKSSRLETFLRACPSTSLKATRLARRILKFCTEDLNKKKVSTISLRTIRTSMRLSWTFDVTLHETSHHLRIQLAFKFITFEHSEESCRDYLRYVTCIHLSSSTDWSFMTFSRSVFFQCYPEPTAERLMWWWLFFYFVCCARWNIVTFWTFPTSSLHRWRWRFKSINFRFIHCRCFFS